MDARTLARSVVNRAYDDLLLFEEVVDQDPPRKGYRTKLADGCSALAFFFSQSVRHRQHRHLLFSMAELEDEESVRDMIRKTCPKLIKRYDP